MVRINLLLASVSGNGPTIFKSIVLSNGCAEAVVLIIEDLFFLLLVLLKTLAFKRVSLLSFKI